MIDSKRSACFLKPENYRFLDERFVIILKSQEKEWK